MVPPATVAAETPTSVKVKRVTHQKLKAGATSFHSINDYLDYLLELDERQRMIEAMRTAISKTPANEMDSYRREATAWENAELADQFASR